MALAAVDEGLLELMPNRSWEILSAMMGRRGYGVQTATAQMQVIGKRHFGLKALPQGGGGGRQTTRELFDTLLLWKARVPLDANGEASVEVPLNDSITSFRIVAVATGGAGLFGTGVNIDPVDAGPDGLVGLASSRPRRGSVQGRVYASKYDESEHGGRCFCKGRRNFSTPRFPGRFLGARRGEGDRMGCGCIDRC